MRQVRPGYRLFIGGGIQYLAVAVAAQGRCHVRNVGVCLHARVITGQGAVAVLEPEESRLDAVLLADDVPHPGAGDEFLSFQHTA